jgi:hypothetical protein
LLTPKRAGYATLVGPGYQYEADTVTCCHCNSAWYVRSSNPAIKADPGGWCRMCMKAICPKCADKGGCKPFLRKLEEYEAKQRMFKEIGI